MLFERAQASLPLADIEIDLEVLLAGDIDTIAAPAEKALMDVVAKFSVPKGDDAEDTSASGGPGASTKEQTTLVGHIVEGSRLKVL